MLPRVSPDTSPLPALSNTASERKSPPSWILNLGIFDRILSIFVEKLLHFSYCHLSWKCNCGASLASMPLKLCGFQGVVGEGTNGWSQGSLLSTKTEEVKVSDYTLGRSESTSRGQNLKPNRQRPGLNTFGRKKVIYKGPHTTGKESSIQETECVWYGEKGNRWMGTRGLEKNSRCHRMPALACKPLRHLRQHEAIEDCKEAWNMKWYSSLGKLCWLWGQEHTEGREGDQLGSCQRKQE